MFDPTRAFADGPPVAAKAWPGELQRRASAKERILARLEQGPALNTELNDICFRYGARILELRREWRIVKEPVKAGVYRYTLMGKKTSLF